MDEGKAWTIESAAECYGIERWSGGFFRIGADGDVHVVPDGRADGASLSLPDVVRGLRGRGLDLPVLLRVAGILDARLRDLNETFARVMESYNYRGGYRGVYPIKVNQQQQVVEEIADFGAAYHHGFEAGSKAELIAAVSYLHDPDAYLVCNGFKDEEFIDLGLYARKMGIQCVFVLETVDECRLIIRRARALGVEPLLGMRAKLSTRGGGHWNESGGDRSVFGLNAAQMIEAAELLKSAGLLDCLRLLHFHLGSQVNHIRDIRLAAGEAARMYAGLAAEGAPMGVLDLGGGLAVDYDGSHSSEACSCNYTLEEYAAAVIEAVQAVADQVNLPHPVLMTESGRATVAYYSVLLFNILDVRRFEAGPPPPPRDGAVEPDILKNLRDVIERLDTVEIQESFHDAVYYRDEARLLFRHGSLSLRQRALAEQCFWHALTRLSRKVGELDYVPDELAGIERTLADIYYGNFSVFQSLPDLWAIDQLFPIMPIHRLDEEPVRRGILSDITCDCDGRIDRFIGPADVRRTLPLHDIREDEEYILGAFLVGAYQETLGDLHNLLGDTNIVSVRLNPDGEADFVREIEGDSVADVLSYVEYDTRAMEQRLRHMAETAVRDRRITVNERREILQVYRAGLEGYTYFET